MKNTIKAICVIIGTIIGAGFASGKEIYLFFNIYGIKGLYGIAVASIITGIVIYKVLLQIRNREYTRNYKEYLEEKDNSIKFDESKTLYNLLRNAIYKQYLEE